MNLATSSSWTAEFIFHGTGSSGSVPNIECLTASTHEEEPCQTCHEALTPQGKKNNRRNTGAIIRVRREHGTSTTIIIDVGKNFRESAIEWFPKYSLRKIDAVLLTHAHADAVNGLDDLRSWTHGGAVQSHIDIYAAKETFAHVQKAFPYLISSEFASGGGDVPKFEWHIIEPSKPFLIEDIEIYPFYVQHGILFSSLNTVYNTFLTPASSHPTSPRPTSPSSVCQGDRDFEKSTNEALPFFSMGFVLLNIVYMSDVSDIPPSTWDLILSLQKNERDQYTAFVVDCLKPYPHTSHFGLAQAVTAAQRLGAQRTYMVGFTHQLLHDEWEKIGEYFGESEAEAGRTDQSMDWAERMGVREIMEEIPRETRVWIRPAYDGLRFVFDSKGIVV